MCMLGGKLASQSLIDHARSAQLHPPLPDVGNLRTANAKQPDIVAYSLLRVFNTTRSLLRYKHTHAHTHAHMHTHTHTQKPLSNPQWLEGVTVRSSRVVVGQSR